MPSTRHHLEALVALMRSTAIAGLLVLVTVPCRADIAPESGLLMHVQAVSGSCGTQITHCSQITRSTNADGPLEFLIFFMRGANSWPGERVCLRSVQNALTWPEAWQLVTFEVCGGGYGSLDPGGATHALSMTWTSVSYRIADSPEGVVPVARLVMNVVGPGRLAFAQCVPVVLQHSCSGSNFNTRPIPIYAEAGMTCGFISPHCGYYETNCEPWFDIADLLLDAAPGGLADTTVEFHAWAHAPPWPAPCIPDVYTHAAWCTGWTEFVPGGPGWQFLHVTADAGALQPGTYETEIELDNGSVARCLPLTFRVENPTATSRTSWGSVKALFRPDAVGDR